MGNEFEGIWKIKSFNKVHARLIDLVNRLSNFTFMAGSFTLNVNVGTSICVYRSFQQKCLLGEVHSLNYRFLKIS